MVETQDKRTASYPMVPIRDVVVFPAMMVPFVIGRDSSVKALEVALKADKKIYLATQKDASQDSPSSADIYEVGTVSNIVQSLKLPDGNIKVLVEGVQRARTVRVSGAEGYFRAEVEVEPVPVVSRAKMSLLTKRLNLLFEEFAKLNPNVSYETSSSRLGRPRPSGSRTRSPPTFPSWSRTSRFCWRSWTLRNG